MPQHFPRLLPREDAMVTALRTITSRERHNRGIRLSAVPATAHRLTDFAPMMVSMAAYQWTVAQPRQMCSGIFPAVPRHWTVQAERRPVEPRLSPERLSCCRFTAETSAVTDAPPPIFPLDEEVLTSTQTALWLGAPDSGRCSRSNGHGRVLRATLHSGPPRPRPHLNLQTRLPPAHSARLKDPSAYRLTGGGTAKRTAKVQASDLHVPWLR